MSIANHIIFKINDVIHLLNEQQLKTVISEFKCKKNPELENFLDNCINNNIPEEVETYVIFDERKIKEKKYLIEGFFALNHSLKNIIHIQCFCKYIGDNYVSDLNSKKIFTIIEDTVNKFILLLDTFTITLSCPANDKLKTVCTKNGFSITSENDSFGLIEMSKTLCESSLKQENRVKYTKEWKCYEDQLNQLLDRGLTLENYTREKALNKLEFIGYYRLSGYAYYFKDKNSENGDQFFLNTSFNDLMECYKFDRKMRLLILDAVERLEIALRANIAYELTKKSPFYIYDDNNFNITKDPKNRKNVKRLEDLYKIREIIPTYLQRSKVSEQSIEHLLNKYVPPYPLWIEIQVFDFGTLWKLFNVLNSDKAKIIAQRFGVTEPGTFNSWLQSIKVLRNICAHHSRLLNRKFTQVPRLVKDKEQYPWLKYWTDEGKEEDKTYTLFYHICIIHHMLEACQASKTWNKRVRSLICEFPKIESSNFTSIQDMIGCGKNWEQLKENAPDAPILKNQNRDPGPLNLDNSTT